MKNKIIPIALASTLLTGCNEAMVRQNTQAILSDLERNINTFTAALDQQIKIAMSSNDRTLINQSANDLLNGRDDVKINGENVSGSMRVTNTSVETRNMKIAKIKTVDAPNNLKVIGKPYAVTAASVNVRSGPSTSKPIITNVKQSSTFEVVGSVENGTWYLISNNGTSFGYVFHTLMKEADKNTTTKNAITGEQAIDLDSLFADQGIELDDVAAETECKEIESTLSGNGETENSSFTACKGSDGVWEI